MINRGEPGDADDERRTVTASAETFLATNEARITYYGPDNGANVRFLWMAACHEVLHVVLYPVTSLNPENRTRDDLARTYEEMVIDRLTKRLVKIIRVEDEFYRDVYGPEGRWR